MVDFRGRYFKYKGELAKQIVNDYASGMLVKEIINKYSISRGGLYGLLKRELNQVKKEKDENQTSTN